MNTRQVSDWTHDFHFLYALKPIWLRLTDIIPTIRKIWWIVKLLWNHSWIQISIIWEFNSPLHLKINRRLTTSLFFLKIYMKVSTIRDEGSLRSKISSLSSSVICCYVLSKPKQLKPEVKKVNRFRFHDYRRKTIIPI